MRALPFKPLSTTLALLTIVTLSACNKPANSGAVKGEVDPSAGVESKASAKSPGQKRTWEEIIMRADAADAAEYSAEVQKDLAVDEDTAKKYDQQDSELRESIKAKKVPLTQGRSYDDAALLRLQNGLIAFDSVKGMDLLTRASAKRDFFTLFRSIETQMNGQFCNAAAAVVVLNAMHHTSGLVAPVVAKPRAKDIKGQLKYVAGFGMWTQENLFEFTDASEVRAPQNIIGHGMDLDLYGEFLKKLPITVEVTHAGPAKGQTWTPMQNAQAFMDWQHKAINNVMTDGGYMIVNYHRTPLGQPRGAHYSPIAAYAKDPSNGKGMFLVLDVARFKLPAYWVPEQLLWEAMATEDSDEALPNRYRGYIEVKPDAQYVSLPQ